LSQMQSGNGFRQRGHSAGVWAAGLSLGFDIDRLLRPAISRFNMRDYRGAVSGKILPRRRQIEEQLAPTRSWPCATFVLASAARKAATNPLACTSPPPYYLCRNLEETNRISST
ncbi:MAG: hypothetical protein ACM3OF_03120, partial [Gemmatimonas sp.]